MSSFQQYYLSIFSDKYAKFDGRADRSEFWMYALYNALIVIALYALDTILFKGRFFVLLSIYGLAKLLPELALSTRRLHDIGKSGYYMFWSFLPIIGWVYLTILFCRKSNPGSNQYGPTQVSGVTPVNTTPITPSGSISTTQVGTSGPVTNSIRNKWGGSTSSQASSNTPAQSSSPRKDETAENIRQKW